MSKLLRMRILYVNKNVNLSPPIINGLRDLGHEVDVLISSLPKPICKKNYYHRAMNIFFRVFRKDRSYFERANAKAFQNFAEKQLKNHKYDISFFIRADQFSERLVKKIRKRTQKMVNYQWDGLDHYPKIFDYFRFFDRLLVFTSDDIKKYSTYKLYPLPIFHHGTGQENFMEFHYDFFYCGVGLEERIRLSKNLEEFCVVNNLKFKALLTIPSNVKEVETESVSLIQRVVTLKENENLAKLARVVVDYKLGNHNGIAFRYYECMKNEKKMITNNKHIKDYEFYHPNNIFICDFKNFNGLNEFLEKPYHSLDPKMVNKYGINNWVRYALDLPPYEKLTLPNC